MAVREAATISLHADRCGNAGIPSEAECAKRVEFRGLYSTVIPQEAS
jgi:hypothetical protein